MWLVDSNSLNHFKFCFYFVYVQVPEDFLVTPSHIILLNVCGHGTQQWFVNNASYRPSVPGTTQSKTNNNGSSVHVFSRGRTERKHLPAPYQPNGRSASTSENARVGYRPAHSLICI